MQVAFGLLQFLSSVGSGGDAAAAGVNAPIGLNSLLSQYQLPPNPLKAVMHARMEREPQMFERRPLEAQVLQYAGGPPCRVEESRVAQQSHWQLRCRPACRTALRLLFNHLLLQRFTPMPDSIARSGGCLAAAASPSWPGG